MNLFRLFFIITILSLNYKSYSQHCGSTMPSSVDVCIQSGNFEFNKFPSSSDFPCLVRNVNTDVTSSFSCLLTDTNSLFSINGTSVVIDTVYALRIDSIANLPCGICWATNKVNNSIQFGEEGCIRLIGNTMDLEGFYELDVKISLDVTGTGFTLENISANSLYPSIFLSVISENATCTSFTEGIVGKEAGNCQ